MALGTLSIIYGALVIIAVILQALLYKGGRGSKTTIYVANMIFALLVNWIAFSALAINFTGLRALALIVGAISVLALVIKVKSDKLSLVSKILLSLSVVGGLVQLFV